MTKSEFFNILENNIKYLPKEEKDSALEFYHEYFNEAESEEIALKKLEHPKDISRNLILEFGEKKPKSISPILLALLIISSPISLPLAFALITVAGAIIFSIFVVFISLIFTFILLFGVSLICLIPAFIYNIPTGLIFLGLSFISIFLFGTTVIILDKFIIGINKLALKFVKEKNNNEKK